MSSRRWLQTSEDSPRASSAGTFGTHLRRGVLPPTPGEDPHLALRPPRSGSEHIPSSGTEFPPTLLCATPTASRCRVLP